MGEFLTNEQIKEFAKLDGITRLENLLKEASKQFLSQNNDVKVCFPTPEEMGYKKIVHCKDCIHRPRKHWEGDEYEIVAPKNQNGKNDYTCYCSWLHIIPGDSFYCGFGEKND